MRSAIAFTVAAVLSGAALAQQGPPAPHATPNAAVQPPPAPPAGPSVDVGAIFDKLNTSHTGKLTREEAQAHPVVAANFDSADTNHDGVLTKDEFLVAFKPQQ
jgi:hypothetical protein